MFQLPQAIQTDNTPVKLLYQAAASARENQQQIMQMIEKDEQTRREAFGGAQKQLFDIASAQGVPAEVQRNLLQTGMDQLTQLYKDRKNVRASDLSMVASDVLMKAKSEATAYQQYLTNGEKFIADLKEQGFNEVNLKTALANNMFTEQQIQTPKGVMISRKPVATTELKDPMQFLAQEIDRNPQKYLDRGVGEKKLNEVIGSFKPAEMKTGTTKDLTGTKTVKVSYTEKTYPWTRTEERDLDGQKVKINVLDTEPLTDSKGNKVLDADGNEIPILSTKAMEYFTSLQDPVLIKEIDAKGRDAIDANNRALGVNPQQITEQNFAQLALQHPGLVNPFDAGNRAMYSRLAMTKKLMPSFGKFGDASVTIDVAKPTTVNVSSDLYTRTGNLKPEARFPTAWAQIINQDADVMRVAENMSFQFDGKTITGRRVGDRAQGQIIKDNGKRATVIARPEEPGAVYIVELDTDGEPTDVVTKLSGQQAVDYGAKISSANGSDIKTFNRLYGGATKTVVPMSDADRSNVGADVSRAAEVEEGKALLGRMSQIKAMKEGETITANNARVKISGKEVRIKSIFRKDTGWFSDSPIIVTLADNTTMTFNNRDEFSKALLESNK